MHRTVVSLVAALTLFASLGAKAADPKVIRIGALYPLSGAIASTGLDCKRGVELAVDIINGKYPDLDLPNAKDEGIASLGGAKLEIVFADSKGEPKNGIGEVERLVTQEHVVAMIGAYQSSVTKTASQAAERLQIPFVCSDASSPTLTKAGFKYFFRASPNDSSFAKDQIKFLNDMKAKGKKIETIAILNENTEFGSNVAKEVQAAADAGGFKVIDQISYTANATDVTSEVGRLIKDKPDVLIHASYITDAILFTKTFKEMKFQPTFMLGFAGYIEPAYVPGVQSEANDIVVRSTFALDLGKKKPLIAKVAELFKKKYGVDMSENAARSFTAPFVLADSLSRAKSTDSAKLQKAIQETNIPSNQIIYPWAGIKFNPATGQNDLATGILVQIQKGQYVTVWPFDSAAADVQWPLRPWGSKDK
jgi:branched-chain amino acid transport system substrate-binding protein